MAALLAAPTSLWMVAMVTVAMLAVPRPMEVLPMVLKTLF